MAKLSLLETAQVVGTNFEEFKELITEMDKSLSYEAIPYCDIDLMSFTGSNEEFAFYEGTKSDGTIIRRKIPLSVLTGLTDGEELLKEILAEKNPVIAIGRDTLFADMDTVKDMFFNVGRIRGNAIEEQSRQRDEWLQLLLKQRKEGQANLCVRRESGVPKVFGCRTQAYKPVPLKSSVDIIENLDLGEVVTYGFSVSNQLTQIVVGFPEIGKHLKDKYSLAEDLIPGIKISNSGTGDSKLSVTEMWTIDGVSSEHKGLDAGCIKKKHSGEFLVKDFLETCKEEIFDEYSRLPKALVELFDTEITTGEEDYNEALEKITPVIESVFEQVGLRKALSATDTKPTSKRSVENVEKCIKEVANLLATEYALSSIAISAYDVAINIMKLPNRIDGLPASYVRPFINCCGKAAYCDYTKIKKSKKTTEPLVLVG